MTSLQQYARDRELPARLGDESLVLPSECELRDLVEAHLCRDDAPRTTAADLTFARWKPGTAVLGCWAVEFGDGERLHVSLKRYAGGKAEQLAPGFQLGDRVARHSGPFEQLAFLADSSSFLTVFPADRVLRGAARALDLRRTARMLDESQLWPGLTMRRRSSTLELLRYKPERRAVMRLDVKLKRREGSTATSAGERRIGVRVLTPEQAAVVAERRELCGAVGLPELHHAEVSTGLLFEEWVDGVPVDRADFRHAVDAANALSELHSRSRDEAPRSASRSGAVELLERVPGLSERVQALTECGPIPTACWIHGDFHPDQLMRTATGLRLLDADALRPGTPEEDLADWIADHLAARPEVDLAEAAGPLIEGLAVTSRPLNPTLLRKLVTEQLLHRAAASLRRLQAGAVEQASSLVERAHCAARESMF